MNKARGGSLVVVVLWGDGQGSWLWATDAKPTNRLTQIPVVEVYAVK